MIRFLSFFPTLVVLKLDFLIIIYPVQMTQDWLKNRSSVSCSIEREVRLGARNVEVYLQLPHQVPSCSQMLLLKGGEQVSSLRTGLHLPRNRHSGTFSTGQEDHRGTKSLLKEQRPVFPSLSWILDVRMQNAPWTWNAEKQSPCPRVLSGKFRLMKLAQDRWSKESPRVLRGQNSWSDLIQKLRNDCAKGEQRERERGARMQTQGDGLQQL